MRLSFMKSGSDKIVYVVDSIRVGDKIKTKTVKRLGRLSDLEKIYGDKTIDYCKKQALILTEQKKKEEDSFEIKFFPNRDIDDYQKSFNIGYLFLQKIYYGLKLDVICEDIMKDNKASFDLNSILKNLIFTRILYPSSKLSSFEEANNFIEQPNYELHDIYRSLDVLSNNIDLIQKEVYKNSSKLCNRNTNILYYDCTNYFFEIEKQDGFRNYGYSKQHQPSPIVQMGLFMDGNGIPLAFNINPGNTNEQITPIPTEKLIEKDFGLSKFIYCSDAGLGSYNIKWFNNLKDRSFIVTQSLKKLKKHLLDWALNDSNWNDNKSIDCLSSDEIIYKSRPINEKGNIEIDGYNIQTTINQRLIVTYSPLYARYQKQIREEQIERAKKLIKNPSKFDKHTSTDFKRFITNLSFDKNGEIVNKNLSINYDQINKEEQFDGYYALITNLEGDDKEIININHNRWKIEESFRIMKTEFKARPVYLQKENRIKAHFLTCYLALLIFRIIEQKINNSDNHFTVTEITKFLKNMNLFSLKDIGYASNYKNSPLLQKFCSVFNLSLNKEAYLKTKLNKIIKNSKII